jgi:gas vesicle protein
MNNARRMLAGLLAIVTAGAAIAVFAASTAIRATRELAMAKQQQDSLAAQIALAEQRTGEGRQ